MSSKTPIYALNQWEGTDHVSRAEINENFQIMEQVISGLRTYQQLMQTVTSGESSRVSLDFSGFDWGAWHEIVLEITAPGNCTCDVHLNNREASTDPTDGYCSASPIEATAAYSAQAIDALGRVNLKCARITLYPNHDAGAQPYAFTQGPGCNWVGHCYRGVTSWSAVTAVNLNVNTVYSSAIPAGTKVTVWGVA